MSTIDLAYGGDTGFPSTAYMKNVGVVSRVVDFAKALTDKGSALATGDVIQAINLPAGTLLLGASVAFEDVPAGGVSGGWLTVGVTGGIQIAGVVSLPGTADTNVSAVNSVVTVVRTADTVDITITSLTGVLSSGQVRIDLVVADVRETNITGTPD